MTHQNKKPKKPRTSGYRPHVHFWGMQPRDLPLFNALYHVPVMMLEPTIRLGLAMRAGPLCQTEFAYKQGDEWIPGIEADDPTIGDFVERNLKRIWDLHIGGLLDAQKWGWAAAEVVLKQTSAGFIEIAELLHRQAQDVRPLTRNGKVAGVRFLRIEDAENGRVDLEYPYCLWHPFRPEPGQYFGVSICKGAFSPFWDKWMDGGALDVRRLFMHKDAYGGVDVSYPDGFTEIPITTGSLETRSTPNANIAREMAEQIKAGGVTTRPAQYDQSGKELWTVTRATVPANPAHILTYPKDLDTEMNRGLEIPDDVLESTDGSGGAWAGKTVPQGAFYTGLELWRTGLFGDIKPVLDHLVRLNFSGRKTWYAIKAKPMALQATEQQGKQPSGASAPAPNPLMMSLEAIGRGLPAGPIVKAAKRLRMATDANGAEHKGKGEGGGQFVSKGDGGSSEASPKRKDKGRGASKEALPSTREEAKVFATALRELVLGDEPAEDGNCLNATMTACQISDDVETWFGAFGPDRAGHHVIVANGYLIDVTADQFGEDYPEIIVIPKDKIDGSEYGNFRPSKFRETYRTGPAQKMDNFWELVGEFDGGDRMSEAGKKDASPDKAELSDSLRGARRLRMSTDAKGRSHKAKGPGGGQFVSKGKEGAAAPDDGIAATSGQKKPAKKKFGKSAAEVHYASKYSSDQKEVDEALQAILGTDDAEAVASIVGAPDDAIVKIRWDQSTGSVQVEIEHEDFNALRKIKRNKAGQVFIKNEEFFMKPSAQGKGIGAEVFGRQVENARELGVAYIRCHAAKENPANPDRPHNGFYTWPRFGYDANLDDESQFAEQDRGVFMEAKSRFGVNTLIDLMASEEGRKWWKENGQDILNAKFDLSDGSRSMTVFNAYLDEKEKLRGELQKSRMALNEGVEAIELSQIDELALQRAWDRLVFTPGGKSA